MKSDEAIIIISCIGDSGIAGRITTIGSCSAGKKYTDEEPGEGWVLASEYNVYST